MKIVTPEEIAGTITDNAAEQEALSLVEVLADLNHASPDRLATANSDLLRYQELIDQLELPFKPLLDVDRDLVDGIGIAGTVGLELSDIEGITRSLVTFSDGDMKPYIVDPSPNCFLPLGTMSHEGDWWLVDTATDDMALSEGLTLAFRLIGLDEKDDTVFVEFNPRRLYKTARYISKFKQLNIITTADRLTNLKDQLKGCDVLIYPSISAITALEAGHSLEEALEDITPHHAQELAIPHLNGFIESRPDGLYFVTYNDEGEPKLTTFICSKLEVLARSRNEDSKSWGLLLEWLDYDKIKHRWAMPAKYLQGDAGEYLRELASQGLRISTERKAQQALSAYLANHPTTKRAICVDSVGWHNEAYVLPNTTLNSGNNTIVYQPNKPIDVIYTQQGTLQQWREELSSKIGDQSRVVFAVSCAFSGQLLKLLGVDGGGFHITGGSSMGKSIGLKVAGSVWGNPDRFIKRWRSTDNGLEAVASTHNDSFLGLDEISEGDPKAVGLSAYMLANGQSKIRANASGGNRPADNWRLIFLSNGEKSLESYLRSANIEVNAGQLIRLLHIEADAGKGYRSFDSLVLSDNASEQANIIKQLASRYYGTAGIAWLEYITQNRRQVIVRAEDLMTQFKANYTDLREQAYRGAERFALVATAGEIATEAGITGWKSGQATEAVKACLDNWLESFGRDGSHEERRIIEQVKSFIERHGSSRFQQWHRLYGVNEQKVINRVGWYKKESDEYLFYTEAFDEVCGSYEARKVLQVLQDEGYLKTNEGDRKTLKTEIPESAKLKRLRMYCVSGDILFYDPLKISGTSGTSGTSQ